MPTVAAVTAATSTTNVRFERWMCMTEFPLVRLES
jgi:hypothetical protein